MSKKVEVAIAGMGMVGSALANVLKDPIIYDPPKGIGNEKELNKARVVFVCVPTPYKEGEGCDTSLIEEVVSKLKEPKAIVIKSTVIPGTTDKLQEKYPKHQFLFNPEFLTEATADQDMKFPDRQIVGFTQKSYPLTGMLMLLLPLAPFEMIMPAKEAEMVKYFANCWFSAKVIYANQMYDLCQKLGINYDVVKQGSAFDKRIGRTHLDIFHKGYRGYGGKCLPKDTKSLLDLAHKNGVEMTLLEATDKYNDQLNEANLSKEH